MVCLRVLADICPIPQRQLGAGSQTGKGAAERVKVEEQSAIDKIILVCITAITAGVLNVLTSHPTAEKATQMLAIVIEGVVAEKAKAKEVARAERATMLLQMSQYWNHLSIMPI